VRITTLPTDERLLDLLALRAVEGLDAPLEAEVIDFEDPEIFDEAAAVLAIRLAAADTQPLPASLQSRLDRAAEEFLRGSAGSEARPAPTRPALSLTEAPPVRPAAAVRGPGVIGLIGWLAAAACLAFAAIVWNAQQAPVALTPEKQLASLESRAGIIRTDWLGLDDAGLAEGPHRLDTGLTGRVVWDPATNEGCMVFEGLAANDPTTFQYQLWIFDSTRPTGHLPQFGEGILSQRPVDGGVFDVDSATAVGGKVIVPIRAKLPIGQAAIFAVTVEPPGGVVVSDRDVVTLALVN
jgi:hypothetical protein